MKILKWAKNTNEKAHQRQQRPKRKTEINSHGEKRMCRDLKGNFARL